MEQQNVNRKRKHESVANNDCDKIVEQIFNDAALLSQQQQQQQQQQQSTLSDISNEKSNKRAKILKLDPISPADEQNEIICVYCNLVFNSKAKLIMHEYKYHGNGSSTECPICCKFKIIFYFYS